jgi:hypothetical protein
MESGLLEWTGPLLRAVLIYASMHPPGSHFPKIFPRVVACNAMEVPRPTRQQMLEQYIASGTISG